ncbi:hypothetical protein, partial [Endozoicomonas sp. ONNA1]|uniref:hypothetical protein n=1 Tax=Endozoicomonas sp. ONNA1 TaxID=2828740 RepID=UPI0021487924
HYQRRIGSTSLSRSLLTTHPTIAKVLSSLIDLHLEGYMRHKARELVLFADLKKELDKAFEAADSYRQAIIGGHINDLYEAEDVFNPVLDSQDASNLNNYIDRVKKDCGLSVGRPETEATPEATPEAKPELSPIPDILSLFEEFCTHKVKTGKWKGDRAVRNKMEYRKPLKAFVELTQLEDVRKATKQDARDFKEHLLEEYTNSTPSNYFNRVAALFSWILQERDYIEYSVFKQVGGLSGYETKAMSPVSTEDTRKILEIVRPEYRDIFKLYYYTGLRSNEPFVNMEWVEVSGNKCLKITNSKTKAGNRTIPLHYSIERLYGLNVKAIAVNKEKLNGELKLFTERHIRLYSFRHGITDRLRVIENCPDGLRFAITGHAQEGTTDQHYGDGWAAQIGRMKKVIDQLPEL